MLFIGPISTICDLILFYIMYNILNYKYNLFNSCWFISSIITQSIIINFIRTSKIPFKESNISLNLGLLITLTTIIAIILPYTKIGGYVDLVPIPSVFYFYLLIVVIIYILLISIVKKYYINRYGNWL